MRQFHTTTTHCSYLIVCHTPTQSQSSISPLSPLNMLGSKGLSELCHTIPVLSNSAPIHLGLDSPQCRFVPFSLAIQNRDFTSSNQHCLPDLPCQAVLGTASNFCCVVSWLSLVLSILVFLHKRFLVFVPISVCVLLSPCKQVSRGLANIGAPLLSWAQIAVYLSGGVTNNGTAQINLWNPTCLEVKVG